MPAPPRAFATVFAALVLPVVPTMLTLHALAAARPARPGVLRAIHGAVWLSLVGLVVRAHALWEAPGPVAGPARAGGWVLVAAAVGLVAASYGAIDARTAAGLAQLDRTRRLVTHGIYAHVRHPRYAALVPGAVGNALLFGAPALWIAAAAVTAGVLVLVRVEDAELERAFGARWRAWRARTGALVPRRGAGALRAAAGGVKGDGT